jgi:hypothetical protein
MRFLAINHTFQRTHSHLPPIFLQCNSSIQTTPVELVCFTLSKASNEVKTFVLFVCIKIQ